MIPTIHHHRIAAVIDHLYIHLNNNSNNDEVFENLCLSLSRLDDVLTTIQWESKALRARLVGGDSALEKGIDYFVANHEVPNRLCELPSLIKQVCQIKYNAAKQASIMVLMISVKIACQNGWFPDQDSEELSNLAKKVASNFCSASDFNAEPNPSHPVISTVMSRFFPKLRMGHIFVFLEVKPGFDAYVSDFYIPQNLKYSPGDRIRLFVVQTDNIETSSCLVTPPKVNFLLNGKGVHRRTNLFVDTGPQVPTVVTPFQKYGLNLLQAVGEFNGNYIIVIALMSEVSYPDSKTLQNCEQHVLAMVDADSEVIEGSSRISLNCPISYKRIKTPVKGHSCKHIQCFDFDNYVVMNARRPSWRCPCCNQHVRFSDICIDQKMVKILKEVGPKVSDIIISSDGSWKAVIGGEETTEKSEDKTSNTPRDESQQPGDILDLTQTDDLMDIVDISETEDRKHPSIANSQTNQSSTQNEINFWEGIDMSTLGHGSSASSTSNLTVPFNSTNREVGTFHQNTQQNRPFSPTQPTQQNTSFRDPNQVPDMYRGSNEHQNSNQPTSIRSPRATSQSPGMIRSSLQSPTSLLRPESHAQDRSHIIASANRTAQMSVSASRTAPSYSWIPNANNMPIPNSRATPPSQPATRTDSADGGWRPAGRMRGALMGQAYDEAYDRYIAQPSQHLARPISNATTPLPNNVRPNFLGFTAGVRIPVPNSASAAPPGNNLPNASSQMQ